MTFLNSIILYGIALASIPILIHLLTRRKKEIINFSSLRFLKILESRRIKKLRIQQIILLILRTLIIILIIIAFSRPALKETSAGKIGDHIKTSAVIVLDNSLSSMTGYGNEQFYDNIKSCADEIIKSFQENDQIYITSVSESEKLRTMNPIFDKNKSMLSIKDSKPSYLSADLNKIIDNAEQLLFESKNYNKEIFVCTDLQNTNFSNKKERRITSEDPGRTKLFILTDSQSKKENTSIEGIRLINQILQKNKEIEIETVISNFMEKPVSDLIVNLYLGGRRTAQRTISIDKRSSGIITFSVIPEISGLISGFAEIESDLLEEDNKRYFDLFIPEKVEVLLVSGKDDSENYLKLALHPEKSDSSTIRLTQVNPSRFSTAEIKDYDLVIFDNMKNILDSDIQRLKNFLKSGKGIIIFPGDQTDVNYYNRITTKELNLPKILSIQKTSEPNKGFITFGRIDFQHPIFTGLFEKEKKAIDSPKFYNFFTIEKIPDSDAIIEFSDGNPFLEESNLNNGRILIFGCSADGIWSDFPYKGIFAPIINQAVYYLSTETFPEKNGLLIGDEISFFTRFKAKEFEIEKPDGSIEKAEIQIQSDNYLVKFDNTDQPGIYKLFADKNLIKVFSVNINPKESDLFKPDENEINSLADKVIYFDKEKDIPGLIKQSRFGKEIGKYFLIGAIILLGFEMWIEREKNQKKLLKI